MANRLMNSPLLGEDRKSSAQGQNDEIDPFETIDRAMSPFLKPVKSVKFYVAALEAGRAESSRGSGLLACRRRASDLNKPAFIFAGICGPKRRGHEIAT